MSAERLQKILARAGVTSRRKAEELIRQGRVTVNGAVASVGDKASGRDDAIKVDGKLLGPPAQHRYLLVHKPRGYVSTKSDPEGRPTVLDLVAPRHRGTLFPVGRLDFHSEGLIILTDDGELAQRVSHPRHGCVKTYRVKVKGAPERAEIDRLRNGMVIDGRKTRPARIEPLRRGRGRPEQGNSWWTVEIGEGRTRQIREMFFRVGHPVQKLRRVAIGPISDPRLKPGTYRELDRDEVACLMGPKGGPKPAGERRPQTRR